MPTASIAANAYAAAARTAGFGGAKPKPTGESGTGFAQMLQSAIGSVVESGKAADQKTQAYAAGKADVVDVVTAVAETEVAIESLVSVRDKVIQAYEEIMRMPI